MFSLCRAVVWCGRQTCLLGTWGALSLVSYMCELVRVSKLSVMPVVDPVADTVPGGSGEGDPGVEGGTGSDLWHIVPPALRVE